MSTPTVTHPHTLRSSDLSLTGADIALLGENWELGFTDFPETSPVVGQMLDGWFGHTGLREMPLELLRRKLRRALFGIPPDRRSGKKWQRQAD